MKSYYYVYKYGDRAPKVRHPTLDLAVQEAERLAALEVGTTFEVLQAVALSVMKPASTFLMDDVSAPDHDLMKMFSALYN